MKDGKNDSLKYRVFNVVFWVGIFMSFSASVINYFLGLGTLLILLTSACGLITVGLYIVFRRSRNYELVSLIVVIFLNFIFFPIMWLVSGGTYSSIPYYMIINAGIIALLLSGLQRKIIFLLFALVVGFLNFAEYKRPDLVIAYDTQLARYIDLTFGLLVCLFSVIVLISFLVDSYAKELERSQKYQASLEEKNKEIEAKNKALERSNAEFIRAKEKEERLNRLLSEEKQKLHELSITDYLTGAFNRRFITSYLSEEIEEVHKNNKN